MSEVVTEKTLPLGYPFWASGAAGFLSTLFAAVLSSVSLPLFIVLKIILKSSDLSHATLFGSWWLVGIFPAYICFKNCLIPNWAGLFCWYHFLKRHPVNNAFILYVCGGLYGLLICAIGLAIENYVWPGKGNAPSLRLRYKDLELVYFLIPAALLSGITALSLLSGMMKEKYPPTPKIRS